MHQVVSIAKKEMRILIIHQFFLSKGDAGGSRWNQFAKYWASQGHEVVFPFHLSDPASHQKIPPRIYDQTGNPTR